jgi:KDO2-lipid IV(A) lauroyltransferase
MAAVARPLDWPPADRLVNYWRTKTGNFQVDKTGGGLTLIRNLRRGQVVGLLLDQGMDYYNGLWVDFFGRPACTSHAVAKLARASGAAVVCGYLRRAPDGKFDLHYRPVVPLADSGDPTRDDWENTQRYTREIEEFVREVPEQWFWVHNRWKHRPCSDWPREQGS